MAVTIHKSGEGAESLKVISYNNGLSYAFNFGEAGSPMRTVYLQGDDAGDIRAEYDAAEAANPYEPCRDIWLGLLDPHL
jgi:hypothetical protein